MSTVAEFSKKVAALVAAITEGRKNGDVNDDQWARLTELAGDVNHAVDRFNKGEGGQMAADSALAALETAVVAVLGAPAPTGGTPVPAPAAPQPAPATPTPPSSGTRQGAPSQATPPAAPAPAPSPAPASDDSVAPAWFTAGIVPLANQVNDHETRIKRLEKGGFDWLVAAVVAIVVALVTFVVMTKGDFGDPVKVLASLAIGIFTGLLVEGTRVGIKSRRSSRNAA